MSTPARDLPESNRRDVRRICVRRRERGQNGARVVALLVILLCLTGCATAGPTDLGELRSGANLRATYTALDAPVVNARLMRQVNGSLELVAPPDGEPFRVHLSDLGLLEVRRGRETGPASITGAALGGFVGLIGGMVCLAQCGGADRPILAPLIGIAIGSSVGAAVGAFRAPARWVEVRIR